MDRMESISLAIRNESNEMKWYLDQAGKTDNKVLKRLFETLAEDEKEHMTRIRALHEKLVADGEWPKDVPIEVAGTSVKRVLEDVSKEVGTEVQRNESDLEALQRAVEFEDKGSKFYAELAEACTNKMEEKFFKFLSGIEREHMLSIRDTMFYLEDPDGWFEQKGRHGLDGA